MAKSNPFATFLMVLAAVLLLVAAGCSEGQVSKEETAPTDTAAQPAPTAKTKPSVKETTPKQPSAADRQKADVDATGKEVVAAGTTARTGASGSSAGMTTIYFDFDKSALRKDAQDSLKNNRDFLLSNPDVRIAIEGHCDERGTNDYNLALGERRANAARRFLADLGIDPNRMETISYGEERPADPASTEAAWAKNRRAEFVKLN